MIGALIVAAMMMFQGNLASARTVYSKCLGAATRAEVKQGTDEAAFQAKLPGLCKAEEGAFRAASIATDVAAKIARTTAERNAEEEVGYIRENAMESFKAAAGNMLPPQPKPQ